MPADPAIIDPPADDLPAADPAQKDPAADPPVKDTIDPAQKTPANDDWRADMAGDDPELLKFLGRHQSKATALKEFKQIHADIRSGKYRKPLGDDPTDEEVAAYRKDFGIPDKPEGYLEALPDGLVVGDDDRPFVDTFLSKMHGANAPKSAVDQALSAYYEIVEDQVASEMEAIDQAKLASTDLLRQEWGPDYRRNLNIMHSHLDTLPEAVKEAFTLGKGPDGVPLGYNPEVLKWLTGLALEANPHATVVPGAGANQASAISDEIAKIEKMMRDDRKAYNADERIQARYRELITARDKLPK